MARAVFVVTRNGRVEGVYATAALADAAMAMHRWRKKAQAWRPVGQVGSGAWASDSTTSLARREWAVDDDDDHLV